MSNRILVTGANGLIGSAVFGSLLKAGANVLGSVRSSPMMHQVLIRDMDGQTDWGNALIDCKTVIHAAACICQSGSSKDDPFLEFRRVNTMGTINLANQAAKSGVKRFVFISTVKVCGEGGETSYNEVSETNPIDAYAITKLEAEQGLLEIGQQNGMEVVIVRPPLVYGPGVKGNFASLVKWVVRGYVLPFGSVNNLRSIIALDNLVDFIKLCADKQRSPRAANQVFMISDGADLSTSTLLRKIANAYQVPLRLISVPEVWLHNLAKICGKSAVADRVLGSLTIDISKAKNLLGWHPVISIDQQLEKMAKYAASI